MAEAAPASHAVHHEAPTGFIRKWVFSTDHKVIGIQYYFLALFSVLVGMTLSVFIRFNLAWPGTEIPFLETLFPVGAPGGVMTPEFYLAFLTMHGTIMVFFVLTTAPQGGFGNYFLPIQIGADDMAFPILNMLSFWFTFLALLVLMAIVSYALGRYRDRIDEDEQGSNEWLDNFHEMHAEGDISDGEFRKVRTVLDENVQKELDPAEPKKASSDGSKRL